MVEKKTLTAEEIAKLTIHEKLIDIQQELKAPKSLKNSFAGFNYRSAEGILTQLKPLLAKHKLVITLSDEMFHIGESNYVQATATLIDIDGKQFEVCAYAREEVTKKGMDSAQITGSTSSYARKYALSGLFGIDDNKDPDSQDNSEHQTEAPKASPNKPASDGQRKFIKDLLEQRGIDAESMAQYLEDEFGVVQGSQMMSADASMIIEELR